MPSPESRQPGMNMEQINPVEKEVDQQRKEFANAVRVAILKEMPVGEPMAAQVIRPQNKNEETVDLVTLQKNLHGYTVTVNGETLPPVKGLDVNQNGVLYADMRVIGEVVKYANLESPVHLISSPDSIQDEDLAAAA